MSLSCALFFLDDPEIKADMLPDDDRGLVCPECTRQMDENYLNPDFRVPKVAPDIGHTYDDCQIVSQKFRDVMETSGYQGVEFRPIIASVGFYSLKVLNVLSFTRPPELKFAELCGRCGRFASVWGHRSVKVLIPSAGVPDGIYRSDLIMGYRRLMGPTLIVTEPVKQVFQKAKLRGAWFNPAPIQVIGE